MNKHLHSGRCALIYRTLVLKVYWLESPRSKHDLFFQIVCLDHGVTISTVVKLSILNFKLLC